MNSDLGSICAIACAEAAAPGDPLRDAYMARRQLDELERRDQALFEARVREQSALDAAAEAEAREAEDLFVMQELELMVDGLPGPRTTRPAAAGLWTTCSSTCTARCPKTPWTCPRTWPACSRRPPARCPPARCPPARCPLARCPPARCTAGARQRRGAGAQFEMDEEVIRRSNEQQRAAAGSSAAVAPAGRGRWQRA